MFAGETFMASTSRVVARRKLVHLHETVGKLLPQQPPPSFKARAILNVDYDRG